MVSGGDHQGAEVGDAPLGPADHLLVEDGSGKVPVHAVDVSDAVIFQPVIAAELGRAGLVHTHFLPIDLSVCAKDSDAWERGSGMFSGNDEKGLQRIGFLVNG